MRSSQSKQNGEKGKRTRNMHHLKTMMMELDLTTECFSKQAAALNNARHIYRDRHSGVY